MEGAVANIEMTTLYLSAAILFIAICIIMFSAWKVSRSRIDDAELSERLHELLGDTLGDVSTMRDWYNDCQGTMVTLTKKLDESRRDVIVLENARDAQDEVLQDIIKQVAAISSDNKVLAEEKHAAYEAIHMLYELFIDAIATIKELKGDPPELPREFIIFYDKNVKDSFKGD